MYSGRRFSSGILKRRLLSWTTFFFFDNQLQVFVGKTMVDCCTVHPCHDGDMNFTSNDGLLKGCWMKHHFVQNISGISHFESRLEKWHPVHGQWDVLNPGHCLIAPNHTC
jgi:hypothetical protein